MTKYVLIEPTSEGDAAEFSHMRNYDDDFEIHEGIPLKESFPPDAAYQMSDYAPDKTALQDVLENLDQNFVINEKVKAFLEAEGVQHVEYLPVKLLNHKGREVKERYFVVNMLPLIDCVDLEKTKYEENPLDPERLMNISNLTVHEEKIPDDFQVLRLKRISGAMLIRRDLVEKMKKAGFRGLGITEIVEYHAN
ncbi:hypothetical protein JY651_43740 [Pyxidicoccus parkwayensis]|uniref:Immunity MXAN-0049 protein domain-containing protein n=1 Tax=Pyxidicoccus parkwayensis TaxID=2813578 RepID=A0ABX7NSZ3_9BACT|nr:DUF1629 domain-containing protein [Pyxidicoccus parkwaysis]QSQ21987.1 hypothetical protein JY651_43740 [Pyxidicoccus parkwaysis]